MTRLRRFTASARRARVARLIVVALASLAMPGTVRAHSGPPFPIVTDASRGPYLISIWTDPDTTDDGSAGGQFWIVIGPSTRDATLPDDTRATVRVNPSNQPSLASTRTTARTEPVRGDVTNQFATVVMNHEGTYAVHVEVTGSLGRADIESMVDATYDLRPPPYMLIWYLVPFLLTGGLWTRLLLRRRAGLPRRSPAKADPSDRVHVP
jgi:hypothetical protein